MNSTNVRVDHFSSTASNILITGVLLSTLVLADCEVPPSPETKSIYSKDSYRVHQSAGASASLDNYSNLDMDHSVDSDFEEVVTKVFSDLMDRQEVLGAEFSKVVNANLTDLYET